MFQEMEEMNLKIMGQKEKAFEDYVKQLTEKMDADTARLMAKQEEILTKKLQVSHCGIFFPHSMASNKRH